MYRILKLNESAKLTEADEEVKDKEQEEDAILDDQNDIIDSEEEQDENPIEEESELDKQLDELREILPDLNLRLYQITNKENLNDTFYIIGKVAEDSNDTLMLVDNKPEEVNDDSLDIDEPIVQDNDEELEESTLKEADVTEILTVTNGTDSKEFDFNSLDFGFGDGDYFYNGKSTGAQIGFYWVEEKGEKFIDHLYLNLNKADDSDDEGEWDYIGSLQNITPEEELKVTLSNEDYDKFLKWYDACNSDKTYYNDEESTLLEAIIPGTDAQIRQAKEESKEKGLYSESEEDEEIVEPLEDRFDYIKIPLRFEDFKTINPRYGEDLNPDHQAIMDYLMNCLIELDPKAAEEVQNNLSNNMEDELPLEIPDEENIEDIQNGEEDLEDEN